LNEKKFDDNGAKKRPKNKLEKEREREREIKCMHNHNKKKNHKKINKKSSIGEPDPFPSSITIA
jgi:hypothetical protein